MKLKKASLIFLSLLFFILVFIVGVRHGQNVERTNKVIDILISIPPSPTAQPTQKPLEFKTYSNKNCGVTFLYPNRLEIKESSQSAVFTENEDRPIEVDCQKVNNISAILEDKNAASTEVVFKTKKTQAKTLDRGEKIAFSFKNTTNNKTIFISIVKSLYPLFEKSLEFIL
ncbi:hypothetical protein A2963_04250 [Candidatus Roizmanbacteria bacterium RIFCSPLOWO2_01_FULL_40_13]|nr:MAG: hypothetical protein A2963_04250 [Candidatus Roizmanbacteria bacterium RIFCSPLOWO2_01_FULL_40_13]